MNKRICGFLIIMIMISSIAAVVADNSGKDIQSISKNGISIKFPADWGISKTTSNSSLIAISNLNSIDSNGVAQININIEKKEFKGSFDSFVNKSYSDMEKLGGFNMTSSGEIAVGQDKGLQFTYVSDNNGTIREHKAVWVEKGNDAYVLLYSAPIDQFDSNLKVFDFVVQNFQIF